MYSSEKIQQTQQHLAERGVRYCIGAFVDIHGVPKAKVVPLAHLPQMAAGSERYTGYALDGLGQAPNDDEITSVPDLDHIVQLPWEPKIAWMPADNYFPGQALCAQHARRPQGDALAGRAARIRHEPGDRVRGLRAQAARRRHSRFPTRRQAGQAVLRRARILDNFRWLDQIASCMDELGWDLYSFDHEDGNGQYEFDFQYADALTMCDRLIFFREMAKHYAREQGLIATMMPKPFANRTGTGAHFNMSLYELGSGRNAFACAPAEDPRGLGLTELGYHFIGGILRHGKALCAAFAPTVNSYKRLVRQGAMSYFSWAPVFNSYGSNNRTNSLRVPGGRWALRIAQCRRFGESVSGRHAGAGGRPGRHTRAHRSGQAERGQPLRHQ
jgi:glutamine synthetase